MNPELFYRFMSSTGQIVTVLRGESPPKMVGGGGGWQITNRPRRVGLTTWAGRDPYMMDVPVMFDGFKDGVSVESAIANMNQMQMGDNLLQPPSVTIDGAVPVKGVRWVLNPMIDWGDKVIWKTGPNKPYRVRQDAMVHLLQLVEADFVNVTRTSRGRRATYTTAKGDTLRSIAARNDVYGNPNRWKEIGLAQSPQMRQLGTYILPENIVLRIP